MTKAPLAADWHRAHPMPRRPSFEQRLEWHMAHAEVCSCREMPEAIRAEIARRRHAH